MFDIWDALLLFFKLLDPSLKSFLFKTCNLSNFFTNPIAIWSRSFDKFWSSTISTSHVRYLALSSLYFKIFILFSPSTKTLTVPSGSFKSCRILLRQPYWYKSLLSGSSTSEFFWVTKTIDLSDFITSCSALIDFSLPTNKGTTIDGKITISLNGRTGFK